MNSILIPKPFCFNPKKIKAFVLGCDPSNNSNNGERAILNYAFGIGQDERYFKDILQNLNEIGLHLEDVYVQNLVTEYQELETGKNKEWEKTAANYLQARINEFDNIDPNRKIPVLLTAERLYHFLLNENIHGLKAGEVYEKADIPIPSGINKLGRSLVPLYRHPKYNINHWSKYQDKLKSIFN